jgi:WD40 repeat protein
MYRQLITRRDLFRLCATMAAPFAVSWPRFTLGGPTESPGAVSADIPVRLVREIKYAQLLDVSPDSKKLCLYFSPDPGRSFVWNGQWREKKKPLSDKDEGLRIMETGSWNVTYATKLPATPHKASFFADSRALYVFVVGIGGGRSLHRIVDLASGKEQDWIDPFDPKSLSFSYWALKDRLLLGDGRGPHNTSELLVKLESGSRQEIARAAFGESRRRGGMSETWIAVSADRKAFAYGYNNKLVFRRSDDLEVLWIREIALEASQLLWRVGLPADRRLVAVSVAAAAANSPSRKNDHVIVYEGKTGKEVARLAASGEEGVAISPDGKLLAAGQRIPLEGDPKGLQATVLLFDIASGNKVATLVHGQFWDVNREFPLNSGFEPYGIQFTPDGKYLVTSGLDTKIWEIQS